MVYSNHFVACVLHNGQVQKELANGTVAIPFGSQYELRFRNKHNRRAVVKFFIDGENVSGNGYIIDAHSHIDIKRHRDKDAAFKFVSLDSAEAVNAGKNGPNPDKEKGLIEAHFYLEKEHTVVQREIQYVPYYPQPIYPYPPPYRQNIMYKGLGDSGLTRERVVGKSMNTSMSSDSDRSISLCNFDGGSSECIGQDTSGRPSLQDGCTTEGSMTGQGSSSQYIQTEETYTALKLFLQGYQPELQVQVVPKISKVERENEQLREELAKLENEELKEKLKKKRSKKST